MGRLIPWQSALAVLCLLSSVPTALGEDSVVYRALLESEEHQSHNRELFFTSSSEIKRRIRGPGHGTRMEDLNGSDRTRVTRNGPGRLGHPGAAVTTSTTPSASFPVEMTRPSWRPLRSNPNLPRGPGPIRAGTRNPTPDFGGNIPEFIINRRISIIRQRGGRFRPDRFSLGRTATSTSETTTASITETTASAAPPADSADSAAAESTTAPSVIPNETGTIVDPAVTTPPDTEDTDAPTTEAPDDDTEAPDEDTAATTPPTLLVARTAADPEIPAKCSPKPLDIQIGVDIQLKFPESGLAVCRQEEKTAVLATIQSVLNTALPPEASSRTISAKTRSSVFAFDDSQTVDNLKRTEQTQDQDGIPDLSLFKPVSAATGFSDTVTIASDRPSAAPIRPPTDTFNVADDPILGVSIELPVDTSSVPNLRKYIPSTISTHSEYLATKDTPLETTAITTAEKVQDVPIPVHHASHPTMRDVEGSSPSDNKYNENNYHESRPTMRDVGGSRLNDNNRQRKLQGGATECPDRTTACPRNADFCLFGCMVATTTDCGSSDRWVNLGSDIGDALGELSLACLGSPNVPVVEVNVFQ